MEFISQQKIMGHQKIIFISEHTFESLFCIYVISLHVEAEYEP